MRLRASLLLALLLTAVAAGCFGDEAAEPEPAAPGPTYGPAPGPNYAADAQLAQTGRWSAPFDAEVPAVNMALLNNGRILIYSGVEANESATGPPGIVFFDVHPLNGQSRVVDLSGAEPLVLMPGSPEGGADDLFCSGMTILPDGRVLAVGSSEWHDQPNLEPFLRGGTDARLYDPATNNWTRGADMLFGRWYPTAITLPDGRAMIISGIGSLTNPNEQWPQSEVYDPLTDTWSYVAGADELLPLYPRVTVVPGGPYKGHLFYNTVGALWGPFGEHPLQAEWSFQKDLDLGTPAGWSDEGLSIFGARQHAATVMLPLDPASGYAPSFVTFGGTLYQSLAATPFTETADLSTAPPTNAVGPAMANSRWHLNGVLLPTGEVVAVGGGLYDNVVAHGQPNVAVLPAELYDPADGTWSTLAEMTVERMYHSTAILLPDGRILAGGHVPLPNPAQAGRDTYNPQVRETRLEVFEPPYLFRGPRPVLLEVDDEAHYGQPIRVLANGTVDQFILMRPGATTHAWDSEQRGILLEHSQNADGSYSVAAPPEALVAPPGYYMLFALGPGNGGPVPSVAQFVHLT